MAAKDRRTDPSLRETLFSEAHNFDFFQLMRLMGLLRPGRAQVGGRAKPAEEDVRLGSRLALEFPASAVHELVDGNAGPHGMTVEFFGLFGTQGILPHFYTEYMIARAAEKDFAMADFLNLFNHRLLSMFYRAWEKHQPHVAYERSVPRGETDLHTHHLFDLIGMGTRGLRGRLAFRDESLVFYSGLLAQRPRSASALRGILEDYFQVGVEIVQCVGAWLTLATDDRCHLNSAGVRNRLGVGAVLGDQVWDPQGQLLVRLGPMSRQRFVAFVPGAPASAVLVEWIRFVVGPALRLVVNPVPIASEVPSVRLGDDGPLATHLGWDSWLDAEDFEGDALDAEFSYAS